MTEDEVLEITYRGPSRWPTVDFEFKPRKGLITRYGRKLLEEGAKYYGKITITNNMPTDNIEITVNGTN